MDAEQLAAARRVVADEPEAVLAARARAEQVTTPPTAEIGALVALLASTAGVRHAIEIGTAGGVLAPWLLKGMDPRGVLTCIDADTHVHGLATAAHSEIGIADRVRAILGQPLEVADRLSDDQYDMVVLQSNPASDVRLLPQVERLLHPGGLLIARRVMASPDGPSAMLEAVAADPWIHATMLPVDEGLVIARAGGLTARPHEA
jgi:predicted O-methyltransferase YrrM